MATVRMLRGVAGPDFSWSKGDEIEMPGSQAEKWADGVRAVMVRGDAPETPEGPQEPAETAEAPKKGKGGRPRKEKAAEKPAEDKDGSQEEQSGDGSQEPGDGTQGDEQEKAE